MTDAEKKPSNSSPGSAIACPHAVVDERVRYSDRVHRDIVRLIQAGNYRETACAAVGISSRTLRRWLRAGAAGDERYMRLADDMATAESKAEARDLMVIGAAAGNPQAPGDWRASAWRLERRYPHRYGQQIKVAVAGELEKFFRILDEVLDRESLQKVYHAISATDDCSEAAEFVEFDVERVEEPVAGDSQA